MRTGRPPSWLLDPDRPGPVQQEASRLGPRRRITFPARLLDPLRWYSKESGSECLLVLDEPGRIRVLAWAQHGPAVVSERQRLLDHVDVLAALEDRYRRGRIDAVQQLVLPAAGEVHLELNDKQDVFLLGFPDRLEIWSPSFRQARLAFHADKLDHLP